MDRLILDARTCRIIIELDKCIAPKCGYPCIKADRLYGRGVLGIVDGMPRNIVPIEEFRRGCNECLGCEIHCPAGAIKIDIPL